MILRNTDVRSALRSKQRGMLLNPFRFAAVGDPYFANVSLLLHGEGSDGSTTFTDSSSSPKTVSAFGNAQIDTAYSAFGGSSMLFDGSGDYLTSALNAAAYYPSGDFTVECECRQASIGATQRLAGFANNVGGNATWVLAVGADNKYFFMGYDGTSYKIAYSTTLAQVGVTNHVAGTKQSGYLKVWVNGVLEGTSPVLQGPLITLQSALGIGRMGDYDGNYFHGHLDELRITQGVARYTSNFTRPASAHLNF